MLPCRFNYILYLQSYHGCIARTTGKTSTVELFLSKFISVEAVSLASQTAIVNRTHYAHRVVQ
jgi:hypothetical protein